VAGVRRTLKIGVLDHSQSIRTVLAAQRIMAKSDRHNE